MVAPPTPFRFRAMGLAELLDEIFRLYRRQLALFAGLALVVTLPGAIIGLIAGSYRSVSWTTRFFQSLGNPDALQAMAQTPPPQQDPVLSLLAGILRLIMVPLTLGVIVYAANEVMNGRPPTIVRALEGTLARYWALAGLSLLFLLILATGIMLVSIPVTIWMLVRAGLSVPALVAEKVGPAQAVRRSAHLVEGRWWRTLGIFSLVWIMAWLVSALLGGFVGMIIGLLPGLAEDLRGALIVIAGSLVGALVVPVSYIAITLMYYDLRVRRDGFDLDQLAGQAQPPSAA